MLNVVLLTLFKCLEKGMWKCFLPKCVFLLNVVWYNNMVFPFNLLKLSYKKLVSVDTLYHSYKYKVNSWGLHTKYVHVNFSTTPMYIYQV